MTVHHTYPSLGAALLSAALAYAAHGWAVFPLAGKAPAFRSAHPAAHPCRGECGRDGHGYHDASTDPDRIRAWWRRFPTANVGLPCSPNGIAVVDVDPRSGGYETLCAIEERHGPLPGTLMQITPGSQPHGGLHMLYAHPGHTLPGKLGPGIDVKAKGYVVAAPSVHPNGMPYAWSGDGRFDHPLTAWPDAVSAPPRPAVVPLPTRPDAVPTRFMLGLVRTVLEGGEGSRNTRLFWASCKAAEHAAMGDVDRRAAAHALLEAACRTGLPEQEARRTITSAFARAGSGTAA